MFERFTEGARRTIFFARYEASNLGMHFINTEHVLLGILRDDKVLVRQVLLNLDYEAAYAEISSGVPPGAKLFPVSVDLPLSEHAREALKCAADEADRLNAKHIGTEHLLLALTSNPEFESAKLLAKLISTELLRKRIESIPVRGALKNIAERRTTTRSPGTIEIHGRCRMLESIATRVHGLKEHSFYWERKLWRARDVAFEKDGKRFSFDTTLARDPEKFLLVKGWWRRDQCVVCDWDLFESEDPSHGAGFTNGDKWVCDECYRRFVESDYFSSSYSDVT